MSQIIHAFTGTEAVRMYPLQPGDILADVMGDRIVTQVLANTLNAPTKKKLGVFNVYHVSKLYDREAELLIAATGVVYVSRNC